MADFFAEYRPRVDAELERILPAEHEPPARLHEAMRYAVFGGGKRLRPLCCLMAAGAVGADPAQAMPAACALELIHTYSLVHDDLPCMDDDDLRRGRPTVHRRYDEATAVLVGDGLQTLAFETLAAGLDAALVAPGVIILARAAGSVGMVGGQVADMEGERGDLDRAGVLFIDEKKTAALFAASFALGGLCGGADRSTVDALAALGHDLGVAFQIIDDLLDRRATPEQLGKATRKDADRGKATLVALEGDDAAFAEARRCSERALRTADLLPYPTAIRSLIQRMLERDH